MMLHLKNAKVYSFNFSLYLRNEKRKECFVNSTYLGH